MGQDIAGACGQLALVNPKKLVPLDIEDYGNRTKSKSKTIIRERSPTGFVYNVSRSNLLCFANIALPLAAVSIMHLIRPTQ
jgi:hypothetical protein